jgi:hypothetical protein
VRIQGKKKIHEIGRLSNGDKIIRKWIFSNGGDQLSANEWENNMLT